MRFSNPKSALRYIECRAALNLTWFRAHSEFHIKKRRRVS